MLEEEQVKGESERGSADSPRVSASSSLLVIGLDSMIGSALAFAAEARGISCSGTSRRSGALWHLDLEAPAESWRLPKNTTTAILCAAKTNVDFCERHPTATRKTNTLATIELADRLAAHGTSPIFLSTSRVFPPWFELPAESTPPEPVTEYGRQKLAVEEHLLRHHPNAKIIRLAKIVSPHLPLFASWQKALAAGETVEAYSDLFLSPVHLPFATEAILQIALGPTPGIFHISASDAVSYFDVARFLAGLKGAEPSLVKPTHSPQPNTPGSAILSCRRTMENTTFRPSTSMQNLHAAFARATP